MAAIHPQTIEVIASDLGRQFFRRRKPLSGSPRATGAGWYAMTWHIGRTPDRDVLAGAICDYLRERGQDSATVLIEGSLVCIYGLRS